MLGRELMLVDGSSMCESMWWWNTEM